MKSEVSMAEKKEDSQPKPPEPKKPNYAEEMSKKVQARKTKKIGRK
jgi:hypothetical protein